MQRAGWTFHRLPTAYSSLTSFHIAYEPPSSVSYTDITTDRQLTEFCERLADAPWIGFDTEFISERSYRPLLCLVQVATKDELAIIDALAIDDMNPFWDVLAKPGHETLVHAGRGELEFSLRAIGRCPTDIFDVQVAAGLAGMEYPAGYRTLLSKLLGETPPQEETRTDWRHRPLSRRQIEYALDDVRYLRAVREELRRRLVALDRLDWVEEELNAWQTEIEQAFTREKWRKVSGNSGLNRRCLAIVRELWRWRESEAERRDCPVRRVLRDDLIIELAKRKSDDVTRIRSVRGLDRGDLKRQLPKIAEHIHLALSLAEDELPPKPSRKGAPKLSVLGQFMFAALGSVCRQANLAPSLVGSPSDVRELIAYQTGSRSDEKTPSLASGWRAQVVGQLFDELLSGKKSIRIADPLSDHPLVFDSFDGP